jgi:hypothetical protein
MAQWKPGPFDFVWRDKIDTTLRLLRSAADMWAMGGGAAVSSERVLAVLLRVFAAEWSPFDHAWDRVEKIRPLCAWLPLVDGSVAECLRLARRGNTILPVAVALAEAEEVIKSAADSWAAGNPEEPSTFGTLSALVSVLFRHRLVQRPPPRSEP